MDQYEEAAGYSGESELKIKIESSRDISVKEIFMEVHREQAREVKTITRPGKRRFHHQRAEEVERASVMGDQRTLYRIVKDLDDTFTIRSEGVIRNVLGNKIIKEEEKVERCREHFDSVLMEVCHMTYIQLMILQGKSWR